VGVLRYSLYCYLKQDYPNRELVVVSSNVTPQLRDFLGRFPAARITIVPAAAGLSLGELRNMSLAHAKGEVVCNWDDDDLYDPLRLSLSVGALLGSKTPAVFLSRWLLWWPARKTFAISQKRPWEGSMLARKEVVAPYRSITRGEDTLVISSIRRYHSIAALELPWLYCYAVTGGNTCDESHFEAMLKLAYAVLQGEAYESAMSRLAARMPIRQYAREITRRQKLDAETFARSLQPA
jgi:glycosyltransferase involved in cell wall biosynthesis